MKLSITNNFLTLKEQRARKIKKIFALVGIVSLVGLTGYQLLSPIFLNWSAKKPPSEENKQNLAISNNLTNENFQNQLLVNQEPEEKPALKKEIDLQVPFTSQAPFKVWDDLHNNACEEAALIMVHYFLVGKELNNEIAEKEIQDLINWQIEKWNEHKDLTLEEVGKMAREYYGYSKIRIQDNINIEDIKREISLGNPVIIPAAGRYLGNPYFRQPGPYYHMLVVRGYKKNKIITNDPGTRRGEKFSYSPEILFQAIHDWPGEEKDILTGQKAMLIIEK